MHSHYLMLIYANTKARSLELVYSYFNFSLVA